MQSRQSGQLTYLLDNHANVTPKSLLHLSTKHGIVGTSPNLPDAHLRGSLVRRSAASPGRQVPRRSLGFVVVRRCMGRIQHLPIQERRSWSRHHGHRCLGVGNRIGIVWRRVQWSHANHQNCRINRMSSCCPQLFAAPPGMVTTDGGTGTEEDGILVPDILLLLHNHGSLLGDLRIQELWKNCDG